MMLGKFIHEQRIKHGMTQEYLAEQIGVSRPTYRQIEEGNRDITIPQAERLADIFDLSLGDFISEVSVRHKVILPRDRATEREVEELEIRVVKEDLEKFKQVLLYILTKVGGKPNVGETVLNKLLYFIDFDYYEKYEESLMGAQYIKNHHGPTAVELGEILKNMQKNNEIEAVKSQHFKYNQKKYLPLINPDLSKLSAQEVEHINDVLLRLSDKSAAELSRYSHGDNPYIVAEKGEVLSYESVFYRSDIYSVRIYDDEL